MKIERNLGVQCDFKVIVRKKDGTIKSENDFQHNLLLDNGLRFFMGETIYDDLGVLQPNEGDFMSYCLVGTGNTTPEVTDKRLQNFVAKHVSTRDNISGKEHPTETLHPGFTKIWRRQKFIFDNINNQNITELGLAAFYGNHYSNGATRVDTYRLMTRALIKDTSGVPIAITVLTGEVLEIIYQINTYIDIKRKTGTFELKTNQFGTEVIDTFEYFMQPVDVSESYISSSSFVNSYYADTTTWGVKEADADLTADYDLYNDDYNKITHLGYADITKNTSGSLYSSGSSSSDKFHQNYQTAWETRSLADLTRTVNVQTGIYSHVYSKGIRAFMIGAGHYDLTKTFVVVKNVANGQGIRKTNRQLWNCAATVTFSRWTA